MSLRTMFKTAAYCSPTIAGATAVFATMGASLSTAGFMGGAAFLSGLMARQLWRHTHPQFHVTASPADLQGRFHELCDRFSTKASLRFFTAVNGMQTDKALSHACAFLSGRSVYFGRSLYDDASAREQSFILAHELAHLTDPDGTAADAAGKVALANFMYLIPSSASFLVSDNSPYFITQGIVAMTGVSQLLLCLHLSRQAELRCDRTAVEITGQPHAAINYLHRLQSRQENDSFSYFSLHPPLRDRKMALARAQMPTLEDELKADMDRYATTKGWSEDRFRVDPVQYTP